MKRDRAFLLVLVAVFAVLSWALVRPFVQYVLASVLLAYILDPLHDRFAGRVGQRISALSLIAATTLVVLVPVLALLWLAAEQAVALVAAFRAGELEFVAVEAFVERFTGVSLDVEAILRSFVSQQGDGGGTMLFERVIGVFGSVADVLIGLTILAFLLYYFLIDGDAFVGWLRRVTPLAADVQDELLAEVDRVTWAVLVGNGLVAVVQGVLTGIGLAIAGVPSVIFWTVMTVFLSLLPLIGASVVWFPASLYLLAVGRPAAAAFLFLYGSLVVSLSDNYLRPMISAHEARLNPGILVVGIFGGVYAFGFMGLFYGPIVLDVLRAVVSVFSREYTD